MELEPTFYLEGVIRSKEDMEDFEGPLTLILMLLSKNKIEIRDIPVSEILDQYLAYLAEMEAMDLEIASEFVQMASHLLYIKTKMLLTSEEEEVSELELLIASLEQLKARDVYSALTKTTPLLLKASEYGALYHTRQQEQLPGMKIYRYQHEGWELLKSLSDVLQRGRTVEDSMTEEEATERKNRLLPKRIVYNVKDKSREILLRLRATERLSMREFYMESRSRSEVVATFISILELCSLGHVELKRDGEEIFASFVGGDVETILEKIGD